MDGDFEDDEFSSDYVLYDRRSEADVFRKSYKYRESLVFKTENDLIQDEQKISKFQIDSDAKNKKRIEIL